MIAPHTEFGKTKNIPVVVYLNNKIIESNSWDETMWIERPEEMYGLMASNLKNKKVRVINSDIWRRARVIV